MIYPINNYKYFNTIFMVDFMLIKHVRSSTLIAL